LTSQPEGPAHALAVLPPEIAFLERHGVPRNLLDDIARRAKETGQPGDIVAIREGYVDEGAYFSALAAEIGAPLVSELPELAAKVDAGLALRTGIIALASPLHRFALAAEGRMVPPLLSASPLVRRSIVLMTPGAFRAGVRQAAARNIGWLAAHGLESTHPGLSARDGPSHLQIALLGAMVFSLAFFGTLEPAPTLIVGGLLLGPLFLLLATFRIAATFEPEGATRAARLLRDDQLPVFTVLVPLFRETAVLDQLIAGITALDYPMSKLDVKLLIESGDLPMREAIAARGLPPFMEMVIVPPGVPQTKPRALNAGLLEARGELVTIFDAEDIPSPGQLRLAASLLAAAPASVACLQARLVIDNSQQRLITRLFALEYAGLFDVINPGLTRSGLPFLIGGTSNHFRIQALRAVGGWDAWNVTEDADLAIRLVRAGYRIGDCPSATYEEAPVSLGAWMRQRRRWMKGYLQCVITHTRQPLRTIRETGLVNALTLLALSLGTFVSAMLYPPFLIITVMKLTEGDWLVARSAFEAAALALSVTLFMAGHIAIFGPPLLGAVRRRAFGPLLVLPLMPLSVTPMSVAALWALVDLTLKPFHWHKTEHGLGKRQPPPDDPTGASTNPPPPSLAVDRG
jgi:cellulose synthase/poly-beta-1,6-N-acetylglucosamine synthase-like glycosyltransferase